MSRKEAKDQILKTFPSIMLSVRKTIVNEKHDPNFLKISGSLSIDFG